MGLALTGDMTLLRVFSDANLGEAATEILRQGLAPHELVLARRATRSVLSSSAHSLEGMDIVFGQPAAAAVLASPGVRWVHLTSASFTRYDTPEFRAAALARGLVLSNSSSVYDEPCAEHVLAFMLAEARQLPRGLRTQCAAGSETWTRLRKDCWLLDGQAVVLVGYGAIARRLAALLAPFHMRVMAVRRRPRGDEVVPVVALAHLGDALAAADHIVNILPDNADSRRFFTDERFDQTKPGAVFYNIGRGTTVDQTALARALRSGRLRAAWLDVTEPEPFPPDHPLLHLENCHVTPHIGGGHRDESSTLVQHFLTNFHQFLDGGPLADRVF